MSSSGKEHVELSSLTDQQRETFLTQKFKMYKLTIAICAVYASFAIIALLVMYFTDFGTDLFSFLITYIIGTSLIVIYLANEIYNFKPQKLDDTLSYEAEMCPDYWKLNNIPETSFIDSTGRNTLSQSLNKNQFKYQCELDTGLFDASKLKSFDSKKQVSQQKQLKIGDNNKLYVGLNNKLLTGINNDTQYEAFKTHAANMNGYTYKGGVLSANSSLALKDGNKTFNANNVPISCDTVYPMYLSTMDHQNVKLNPSEPSNRYRCAYATTCGVSWTEAGCT